MKMKEVNLMESDVIMITKKPGIKDCVRISSAGDIPEFLQEVVKVEGDSLILDCLEGEERAPLGSVIAYEQLESGKMNVWNKANWKDTTQEIDGVFYELPKPNKAVRVGEDLPDYVKEGLGERLTKLDDGTFQIDAGWGLVQCAPNNGYIVIYGTKEDGSLDANFLTKGTPSFEQYFVLDEDGNIIQTLSEYDEQVSENTQSNNMTM